MKITTLLIIGLFAILSYFFLIPSENIPKVMADKVYSQPVLMAEESPTEFVRMPSVPCRPLIFKDKHLSVNIQGIDNCSLPVSSTFDVNWKINQKVSLKNKQYDFIVFSMPHTVRFNGTSFLMLPPEVKLPFGFKFAEDKMRVLFPLYLPQIQKNQGTFQIRPLIAGEFKLDWAYLVVSEKGDIVFSSKSSDTSVTFEMQERKNPRLVVQDRVGVEQPDKVLLSPSRDYEVRVFKERFQVLYAKSGELLFERAGIEPNFSPGSRFLGYLTGTNEEGNPEAPLKIIDLLDQKLIINEPRKVFNVAAWGKNDSFLMIGFEIWGYLNIILPWLETNNIFIIDGAAHAYSAWKGTQFNIELENSLLHCSSIYSDDSYHLSLIGNEFFLNKNNIKYEEFPILISTPKMWEIEGSFKISNIAHKPQRGMLQFFNYPILVKNKLYKTPKMASIDKDKTTIRGYTINRGVTLQLTKDNVPNFIKKNTSSKSLLNRLRDMNLVIQKNYKPSEKNDWQDVKKDAINNLKISHPNLKGITISKILNRKKNNDDDECVTTQNKFKYQYWNNKDQEFLFIQVRCWGGAASTPNTSGDLYMFNNHKKGVSIESILLKKYDHKMIYKNFPLDISESSNDEIRAFLSENYIMLIASIDGSSVITFDVKKNNIKTFFTNIEEVQDIESLHLSKNNKLVLQINKSGHFYLYDIASQQRVLNGLYTDDGFYDGTREGAYYITWHYPGIKQHFAFNQFESKFKRPDIIQAILNGKTVNKPKVQLLPPPNVEMVLNHAGNYAQQATIELSATSILPLSNLRVFIDGVPIAEIPVNGRQAKTTVPIELKRGKHWITAIAHNEQGYSSIPQSLMVDASKIKAKGNNLYVLGIGVDKYPNLPPKNNLDYAK